jgi:D-cysteine desulfhydrase family pyridoxal phosphate-dependent enzyme
MHSETYPRATLVSGETPLTHLPSLSGDLGIDLFIKRDDVAGSPLGGNKARQLEFYLGAARAQGADTILITGAVQSNFVRTAAYAAASLGMKSVVQLEERVPERDGTYHTSGNVLLLRMLGAEIMHYPEGEDEAGADAALRARAETLRSEVRVPYVIPLGLENPPLGALGYVRAGREIVASGQAFDVVVVASGSGATHAGLLTGLRAAGSTARVIGSCVRRPKAQQEARIRRVLELLSELTEDTRAVAAEDVQIWDGALAPGYGRVGETASEAMAMMAGREGILLDPVYTAKSFAAIPALCRAGEIAKGARVLFVHTGGLAALFGYQSDLEGGLPVLG